MREYMIDLSGIMDREALHLRLREALPLPEWYGGNLDALHDALTELAVPARICVRGMEDLPDQMREYAGRLRRVLRDAEEEVPGLTVRFEENTEKRAQTESPERNVPSGPSARTDPPAGRTLIITDIHGCYDECRELLKKMDFREEEDILINLGDTVDRGPKIYETFEYLRGLKERMGERCVLIRGNHEQMMLNAAAYGGQDKNLWYYNSGEKTVFSFLHHKHRFQEFLAWYEEMPYYYTTEKFICVHASLKDPDPEKNDPETLIWGRDTDYQGKLVLTGHTPYRVPLYFQGDSYGRIQEDVWTRLPQTGMIALDTGCVFGNKLTGMVVRPDGAFMVMSVMSEVKSSS